MMNRVINRDFIQEFKNRVRFIDQHLSLEDIKNTSLEVPKGPVYSVYKRSNLGKNKIVFMCLPYNEAKKLCESLNKKEQNKRHTEQEIAFSLGVEYRPDEVFLYDVVEMQTEQENIFWNDSQLTREEI